MEDARVRCGPSALYAHFWTRGPHVEVEWFKAHQDDNVERTEVERVRFEANYGVDFFAKAGSSSVRMIACLFRVGHQRRT